MRRYAFPDARLLEVGEVVLAVERAGFEARDVESLREHDATTLRCRITDLRERWDEAVAMVGERRARVWLLYLSGVTLAFEDAGVAVHQVSPTARAACPAPGRAGSPAATRAPSAG